MTTMGYYLAPIVVLPFAGPLRRWSQSASNPMNLEFVREPREALLLAFALIGIGLTGRLINFASGSFFYLDQVALPFSTASLVAQLDHLYTAGWLSWMGLALLPREHPLSLPKLPASILVVLELLYQVLSGPKGRFFVYVLQPLAYMFLFVRKRVSRLALFGFGGIAVVSWLVIYPTLVFYRQAMSEDVRRDVSGSVGVLADSAKQVQGLHRHHQGARRRIEPRRAGGRAHLDRLFPPEPRHRRFVEATPDGNGVNPSATQPVRRFQWWGWLSTPTRT
jgi:hypothetical protein